MALPHTLPVNPGERWGVVLHNDDHTPFAVVHHLLRTVCGLDADTALGLTTTSHQSGSAAIGSYVRGLRLPRPVMLRRALLRKMFPDTSASRWQSALFRRRHRKVLADRALVDRVWTRWVSRGPFVLTLDEVDEWLVVIGQIRALYLLVRKATPQHVQTLGQVQLLLLAAADPGTYTGETLADSQRCNTSK